MVSKCPSGTIRRKAYTRKSYTRTNGTVVRGVHVKAGCVKDKGLPGKTKASRKVLPKPVKGALGKYGYANIKHMPATKRRTSLTNAVKTEGYAPIIRRLNLIANYNKNSDPKAHTVIRSDIAWIQGHLYSYSKSAQRTSKKRATMESAYMPSSKNKSSKKSSRKRSSKKRIVKANVKKINGVSHQLYHLSGSKRKFYRYRKRDGTMGKRYI